MEEDKLSLLINSFKKCSDKDDLYLMNELMKFRFDSKDVEKYVLFLPIAFGRYYLRNKYLDLQFNEYYSVNDSLLKYSLLDDDVYRWAFSLAVKNSVENFLSKEEYLSIITRSSEIKSVLKGVSLNKTIDGAKFKTLLKIGIFGAELS